MSVKTIDSNGIVTEMTYNDAGLVTKLVRMGGTWF